MSEIASRKMLNVCMLKWRALLEGERPDTGVDPPAAGGGGS